jgi:D-3-phosphoglycerate dehydrogenase / 2-oxoglutarate reductase
MTPPYTCLIVDTMHPGILPMLREIGVAPDYQPDISPEEIKEILPQYDGLMVRGKIFISADLIRAANRLKFVARAGAGVDNIDQEALQAKGIALLNAPEGNADAVGEFTLGLLISLFRNIAKADKEVRDYRWAREENRGEEIMGKTIGLIGFGNMGRAFARRLAGFNCQVLAYDKKDGLAPEPNVRLTSLAELFEEADVLSLHIPYTPENHHFVNENFISSFKKAIWLINTARGEVVNQKAIVNFLKSGKIKGAALDVLENEKLDRLTDEQRKNFDYLSQAPNVILTPHIAGWSHQSYLKINQVLVDKISKFISTQ